MDKPTIVADVDRQVCVGTCRCGRWLFEVPMTGSETEAREQVEKAYMVHWALGCILSTRRANLIEKLRGTPPLLPRQKNQS
jgi:hypothetical protein